MSVSTSRGRATLLSTTMLVGAFLSSATAVSAAQFPLIVQQGSDPLLAGLQIPLNASQVGMWGPVQPWPLVAIHAALLPSGKVVTYGTPQGQGVQDGRTYDVWDPSQGFGAGHVVLPGLTTVNSFCSAQALRTDGSLLISGGIFNGSQDKGSAVLNAAANGISALNATMADDRYYASMITQADGSQLILGGDYPYAEGWTNPQTSISKGWNTGMTPEVYRPASGWTSLWGATSRDAFGPDNSRYWYPRAWVAPNGRIFGISSDNMWSLDSTGSGSLTFSKFKSQPVATASSSAPAPNTGPASTAAMYDKGKILQAGGNSMTNFDGLYPSSRAATIVDLTGATVAVNDTASMTYARDWATATVLPTGKVLVTGGSAQGDSSGSQAVLAAETWDPVTAKWTVGPSEAIYRGYHSNALLMQDGAVLVSGGGVPGPVNNLNAEVYYPPYLFTTVNGQAFLAARPQIVSLSSNALAYGQPIKVEMTTSDVISQVVLVGLSEVTHSFNSGQRRDPLTFVQSGTVLTAQSPASGNEAPPGYYQVVAINANGVPSPGAIVAIGSGVTAPSTTATPTGIVVPNPPGVPAPPGSLPAQSVLASGSIYNVQPTNYPTLLVRHSYFVGYIQQISNYNLDSQFVITPGLANSSCVSFQSTNFPNYYLRHYAFQIVLNQQDGTPIFQQDATFCPHAPLNGSTDPSTVSLQSINYPGYYIRHYNFQLYLNQNDASTQFALDSSFKALTAPN